MFIQSYINVDTISTRLVASSMYWIADSPTVLARAEFCFAVSPNAAIIYSLVCYG